ncbi:MAG: HEAT repeat domain-containing protein, partial [Planctomycetota bacterium]
MRVLLFLSAALSLIASASAAAADADPEVDPYRSQVARLSRELESSSPRTRAGAAEALGYLRGYSAAGALVRALGDPSPVVRREAAMALAWCGGRNEVKALLAALDDGDWTVRQAAWVALTNLTGMEFPYDALAEPAARGAQSKTWRDWWADAPAARPPPDVLGLLGGAPVENLALGCPVTASSTYKGPPGVLTDGETAGGFWQTKNVPFPQHCTVDLGEPRSIGCVVVHQYGRGFCMMDYSLATSADGRSFDEVRRRRGATPPVLVATFPPRRARYVRVTSHASENRTYPTTFREVSVLPEAPAKTHSLEPRELRFERGMRALGALGGNGAARAILKILAPYRRSGGGSPSVKSMVQTGLRALGRLRPSTSSGRPEFIEGRDPEALSALVGFLDNPQWARYAADALGDLGGPKAEAALIAAYPKYAPDVRRRKPRLRPRDDVPKLDPRDRMYETPFAIASALSRLPLTSPANRSALREIAPLLLAALPSDFDGAMLYEPEAYQLVTSHLLGKAGLREAARDAALRSFGRPREVLNVPCAAQIEALAKGRAEDVPYAALWLPMLCRPSRASGRPEHVEGRAERDAPDLIALLEHANGWVRINAAKALMFMEVTSAVDPLARLLAASRPEADHGYFGRFLFRSRKQGQDEHDDPSPRWREAFVRALGRLGAKRHVPLLVKLVGDDRNALEIRHAAAVALDEIGTPEATAALARAEATHPFHSIRLVAREALWRRGILAGKPVAPKPAAAGDEKEASPLPAEP